MPLVTLSDTTFNKLKAISEPFVDTPESRLLRLIDDELERMGVTPNGNGRAQSATDTILRLSPDSHESLAFTKVLSATVAGREMHRPKWNSFMGHLHVLGLKDLGSIDALKRVTGARLRPGRYEEEGYKYLPEADFSIGGVDANDAWHHSLAVARALGKPIKITFQWRDNEGAAHPGQTGVLEWIPTSS